MSWGDIQWGTVGEWTGFLAFLAALGLLWHEFRERRERLEDEEKRQARLVSPGAGSFDASGDHSGDTYVVRPRVHNDSDRLIRSVLVKVYNAKGDYFGEVAINHGAPIRPGSHGDGRLLETRPPGYDFGDGRPTFAVIFTDADGRRWHLHRDGRLTKVRT